MKKILFFLMIFALFSCENSNKKPSSTVDKKTGIISQTDIEDLGIKELKKGKKSNWYENFNNFRENFKQKKLNSDVFLGIGGIYLSQEEAMESARNNGEINIKNNLAISSSSRENFGNIVDSVLEIHKVKYNNNITTAYKYVLLLEVNKVSAFQVIDEKNRQIEEAKEELENKLAQAEEYEKNGDIAFKLKSYAKAIINYKNAKAIYQETASREYEEKIDGKISMIKEQQIKEKIAYENIQKEKLKQINELEIKRNLNEFELQNLKQLYLDTRQFKKAEETEANLQSFLKLKEIKSKKNLMKNYIQNFTGTAYVEKNYISYFNNYKKYFKENELNELLLKKDIINEISKDSLVVLFDRKYFKNKYLNIFTNALAIKYGKFVKMETKEDDMNINLIYKYKSWNIISINSINLIAEKGRYGYRGVFSVTYNYADYKNNITNLISIPATRSRYTDHETPEQALTQVVDSELSGR